MFSLLEKSDAWTMFSLLEKSDVHLMAQELVCPLMVNEELVSFSELFCSQVFG
jgi:hypothetical protein